MNDDDHDRIASGQMGRPRRKYLIRWMVMIFCLVVWIAVAAFFIW
jgi:hypothetical protein